MGNRQLASLPRSGGGSGGPMRLKYVSGGWFRDADTLPGRPAVMWHGDHAMEAVYGPLVRAAQAIETKLGNCACAGVESWPERQELQRALKGLA